MRDNLGIGFRERVFLMPARKDESDVAALSALCNQRIFKRNYQSIDIYSMGHDEELDALGHSRGDLVLFLRGPGRHGAWGKSSFMRSLNSPPRDIADAMVEGGRERGKTVDFLSAGRDSGRRGCSLYATAASFLTSISTMYLERDCMYEVDFGYNVT